MELNWIFKLAEVVERESKFYLEKGLTNLSSLSEFLTKTQVVENKLHKA